MIWHLFLALTAFMQLAHASRTAPALATIVFPRTVDNTTYDFIIAGGGISGLTVADRLTEDPSVKVLVIEAGPFDRDEPGVLVPGEYFPVPYLWIPLPSTPQTALNGRSFNIPAGKVVGGGSVVNAMVFLRPGREELRDWERLGAKGWDWDSLLPYYKKASLSMLDENSTAPDPEFARRANFSYVDDVHGHSGPVQVSFPNFYYPASGNWFEAAVSSGISVSGDPSDGNARGVIFFPSVTDHTTRTRSHARLNHYTGVQPRANYHLLASHTVSKVLFDKHKKAIGVGYLPTQGGESRTARATKEVLLASGALHTPQILQLSGIGPKALLDKLNITVIADLPGVGANFHDQPSLLIPYNVTNNIEPNLGSLSDPAYDAEARRLYDEQKTGPYVITRGLSTNLALPSLREVTANWKSIIAAARRADFDKYLPPDTHPTVRAGYKLQRELTLSQLETDGTPVHMLSWNTDAEARIYFLRPLSRGTIAINSTDPLAHPLIDFQTLVDPIDMELMLTALLKNRELMAQRSMAVLGPREGSPFGEGVTDAEKLKAILRGVVEPSSAHSCCTAAMMRKELGGVVDEEMRVYGVMGLRVVDTSYWPMVLTSAPTATAYASGEKIADGIKRVYRLGEFGGGK
ncbi:oxygen-dependent choline dehydrogenase [Achaetomium macrosporum]|uniref:Oxygen-dependent choline dehydrogenase n=1 Tax=Achaetomium macrosporum TaxID=79813 RepID=A0AAN7C1U8_9PEZI|nr:oxygen-dependent choline dehydrogenase [Achaetomium macrosporum]